MGGRCVDEESDEEGNRQDVRLESLDWSKVGKIATHSFCRTAAIEFMYVNVPYIILTLLCLLPDNFQGDCQLMG
jgi:hypothetical protein